MILIIKIIKCQKKNKPYQCMSLECSLYTQEYVYKLIIRKVENIIFNINLDSSSESDNESDYE